MAGETPVLVHNTTPVTDCPIPIMGPHRPLDLKGKPGDKPSTHFELNPDGSYTLPDEW
ncbi:hypothetical protein ACIA8F_13370 [Streptomyces sp. NPDC051563]|uniref:hypothetical protein n=1 Tax=Streptomyces sp. NPDC051563 TaxID=3365659 RepID=UPI00378E5E6E